MKDIKKVKCFLLDMDGTIYLGDRPIQGAVEAVKVLQSKARVIYFTNNSSKNHSEYVAKLTKLGFNACENDIYTSGDASIEFLNKHRNGKPVYILGTDALKEQARKAGVNVVEDGADIVLLVYYTTVIFPNL